MKPIVCELCGNNQLIKQDGMFVCEYCGTKYTLEEAKKLIVSGNVEVVPGEKSKEKLKQDIQTFVKIKNYFKAIELMTVFTDTYPSDPDGYKIKLDFICTEGCSPFFVSKEYYYKKGDDRFAEMVIQFDSQYVFEAFKKNVEILKKLESIDYTREYALKFLNLIKSASTPFHFSSSRRDFDTKDKIRVLNLLKNMLVDTFGTEMGNIIFTEGINNANVYNQVRQFNSQVNSNNNNIYYSDCIFLLGNQNLRLERYGSSNDESYRFSFYTMSYVPDIDKLKEKIHQEEKKGQYRENKLCQHCGGEFIGFFKKVCSKCKKTKDYYY